MSGLSDFILLVSAGILFLSFSIAPHELIEKDYYSRFMKGLWVVPNATEEDVAIAAIAASQARFEFGEIPTT